MKRRLLLCVIWSFAFCLAATGAMLAGDHSAAQGRDDRETKPPPVRMYTKLRTDGWMIRRYEAGKKVSEARLTGNWWW